MLNNINFERLKVFYYVYSKQSTIAAAKVLNVSQSAVSQNIRKLESELKSRLFTRLHKQLIPTAAGEKLFAVVKPFVAALDGCLNSFDQAKEQPFGELRIGTPVEFGKTYFPEIVGEFRNRYPDVTFYIKLGDPNTLFEMLKKGKIELALVDLFETFKQYSVNLDIFHFQPLAQEEIILACSKTYYENFINKDHSFNNLIKQKFISYRRNALTLKAWFKHHFGKSNLSLQSALIVDSHQAILSAIQHHVGLGIIASHLADKEIEQGKIIGIETRKSEIINEISLTQLQDKFPTFTEKAFLEFLMKEVTSFGLEINAANSKANK